MKDQFGKVYYFFQRCVDLVSITAEIIEMIPTNLLWQKHWRKLHILKRLLKTICWVNV